LDGTPESASSTTSQKKKTKKKKPNKELFRADRVLANRSGKTRSECFKLLQKNAISILQENDDDDDDDNAPKVVVIKDNQQQGGDDRSIHRLQRVSVPDTTQLRTLKGPKEKIPMTARLFINQKFEVPSLPPLLTVFHKPKWMLSNMGSDSSSKITMKKKEENRRTLEHVHFPFKDKMHPVGRLDYDSSGLLLFSSMGALTQTLLHPKYEKEKEYRCVVTGTVLPQQLKQQLQEGVKLVDVSGSSGATTSNSNNKDNNINPTAKYVRGLDHHADSTTSGSGSIIKATFVARADLLDVTHFPSHQVAPYLQEIKANLPSEHNITDLNLRGYLDVFNAKELSEIRLVVTEGKHRMVRRLLATCGHTVVSLKRERIGIIELGNLPEGAVRNLTVEEEEWAEGLMVKPSSSLD
jgi:pseudouridine synthase